MNHPLPTTLLSIASFLCLPTLCAMGHLITITDDPIAYDANLVDLVKKYDADGAFKDHVAWAKKILCYSKVGFGGIEKEHLETTADALILLNGSIDDEIKTITGLIQKNPFKWHQWTYGSIAALLGTTLVIWRKPLFAYRTLGLIATTGLFGYYEIAKQTRHSFLNTQIADLQTLQQKIDQWVKKPSPFQTIDEVPTGNMYPDVDQQQ